MSTPKGKRHSVALQSFFRLRKISREADGDESPAMRRPHSAKSIMETCLQALVPTTKLLGMRPRLSNLSWPRLSLFFLHWLVIFLGQWDLVSRAPDCRSLIQRGIQQVTATASAIRTEKKGLTMYASLQNSFASRWNNRDFFSLPSRLSSHFFLKIPEQHATGIAAAKLISRSTAERALKRGCLLLRPDHLTERPIGL